MYNRIKRGLATTRSAAKMARNTVTGKAVKNREIDGCTSSPDFIFRSCCNWHDALYIAAHNAVERGDIPRINQLQADRSFLECMTRRARKSSAPIFWSLMAHTYYRAVRTFGANYWPTKAEYELRHGKGSWRKHRNRWYR